MQQDSLDVLQKRVPLSDMLALWQLEYEVDRVYYAGDRATARLLMPGVRAQRDAAAKAVEHPRRMVAAARGTLLACAKYDIVQAPELELELSTVIASQAPAPLRDVRWSSETRAVATFYCELHFECRTAEHRSTVIGALARRIDATLAE